MRHSSRLMLISTSLLLLSLSSCSSGTRRPAEESAPGGSSPAAAHVIDLKSFPGTVGQVTYNNNTVRMDTESAGKSLLSVSQDGSVFIFDPSDERVRNLAPGKVMLLENVALRKITEVVSQNGHVVVGTEPAALTDAIQDGVIKWNVPIHLGSKTAQVFPAEAGGESLEHAAKAWFGPMPVVYADIAGLQISGEKDGWHYSLAAQPGADRLNIAISLSKGVKGLQVELQGKGYVQSFDNETSIEIHESQLKMFDFKNKNLKGEMNVEWSAVREGDAPALKGEDSMFKFPANFSAPMPIAGIPFVLEISESVLFQPAFGEKKELGKGSFKVSYNGEQGFGLNQGTPVAEGQMEGESEIGDLTSVSIAPSGLILGVVAPKVELKLGAESAFQMLQKGMPLPKIADEAIDALSGTKLGKYAKEKIKSEASAYYAFTSMFQYVTSGPMALVSCKRSSVTLYGIAGAKATFLGHALGDKKVDLYKKEFKRVVPPVKACDF